MSEYELYHYGVKGMKWGVRRASKEKLIRTASSHFKARNAAREGAKQAISEGKINPSKAGSLRKIGNLKRDIYKESVAKDAAYNKDLRARRAAEKQARKRSKLEANADLGVSNYYKNPIKMRKQINARAKLYDLDTKAMLKGKNLVDKLYTMNKRSLDRPVISISGKQTTAGKSAVETMLAVAGATLVSRMFK